MHKHYFRILTTVYATIVHRHYGRVRVIVNLSHTKCVWYGDATKSRSSSSRKFQFVSLHSFDVVTVHYSRLFISLRIPVLDQADSA